MSSMDGHDEPLLTDRSSTEDSSKPADRAKFVKFNAVWKICSFTVLLLLVSLSFIAELRAFEISQANKHYNGTEPYPHDVCWACVGLRCGFSALAMVSVLWIYFRALKSAKEKRRDRVENIPASVQASRNLCTLPSGLFIRSLVFLTTLNCVSMLIEIGCGLSDIAQNSTDYGSRSLTDHATGIILERSFMFSFALVQTIFLWKNFAKCILRRLGEAWVALSIILAVNIGSLFTDTGLKLQDVKRFDHFIKNNTIFANDTVRSIQDLLYPFQIEFCITAFVVTYFLMRNSGRRAKFVLEHGLRNEDKIDDETTEKVLSDNTIAFVIGLLVLFVLKVAVMVARLDNSGNVTHSTIFYGALLFLQGFGIGSVLVLFCYTQHDIRRQPSTEFLVDRLFLWLGALAIVLNAVYRIWNNFSKIFGPINGMREIQKSMWNSSTNSSADESVRSGFELASEMASIIQCVLQSFQLESMLTTRFSETNSLLKFFTRNRGLAANQDHGDQEEGYSGQKIYALLYALIILNLVQWVLSTVGYTFFFHDGTQDTISLIFTPLVVFYSFHSALFIHHFVTNLKRSTNQRPPAHTLE